MTERDRLYDLIVDIENQLTLAYPYTTNEFRIKETVDHLLANGVTVSPVPVGSTVYAFYANYEYGWGYRHQTRTANHQITTNKSLEVAKRYNVVVREKKATKQDIVLLGRLVFLTREEAEQALKDR